MGDLIERLLDRGVCSIYHNSCRNDMVCEEAAAALEAKDAEIAKLRQAHRLIELLSYREDEDDGWLVAHMRGVANDALDGRTSEHIWRLFPRHRTALAEDDTFGEKERE
jgi:hypothetical protein